MSLQTEQQKENVFDEKGQTIEMQHDDGDQGEGEVEGHEDSEAEAHDSSPKPMGKYKIGDKLFQTQEEALRYAETQVSTLETEKLLADAYRRGVEEAASLVAPQPQDVTPEHRPLGDLNPEDIYANPAEFLSKFAEKIKSDTRAEFDRKDQIKVASDQIWSEFVTRHPMLADFRKEVEEFADQNTAEVRAIIATKGRGAGYDFVATKLKSRFEAYANAVKPKRELPNAKQATSPSSPAVDVTPKAGGKKPLSFAEQVRMLRKKR